jgi:hypothetical protein
MSTNMKVLRYAWTSLSSCSCTATAAVLPAVLQALRPTAAQYHERQAVIERVQSVLAGMPDFQPR